MLSAEVVGWVVVILWTVAAALVGAYLAGGIRRHRDRGSRP